MALVQLKLSRVLDGDDALIGRDEAGEHVEQRGLAGAGPAGDDDIAAPEDAGRRKSRDCTLNVPNAMRVQIREWILGELPDGQDAAIQGDGRNDCVDS